MVNGKLPPKPDPATGQPRPPAAPLDASWGHGHRRRTNRTKASPVPPPGQGPSLAWTSRSWEGVFGGAGFLGLLVGGVLTLKYGGFGWVVDWMNWLAILILSTLGVLFTVWGDGGLAAGADWLRFHKEWVNTYGLVDVKLGVSRSRDTLVLRDNESREFSMGLKMLQDNPEIWDLVYNGMLHSVHYGGAAVNDRARERLLLDPRLHFVHDDDVEGS